MKNTISEEPGAEPELNNSIWKGINKALEHVLSEEADLINSILKDLAPKEEVTKDKSGGEEVITKPSTGISWGSIFKAIGFAFRHPMKAWTLVQTALSPKVYLDNAFQKNLLENDKVWDFVKRRSNDLPKIGQILKASGIKEFEEGGILDAKGLGILKAGFENEDTIKRLKAIAIETRTPPPNIMKIVGDSFGLLANSKDFKQFLQEKGGQIQEYVKVLASNTTAGDVTRSMSAIISTNSTKYADIHEIISNNQALQDKMSDILHQNLLNPALERTRIINDVLELPEFASLSEVGKESLRTLSSDTLDKTKPLIREYLDLYKIDPNILEHTSTLITKAPELDGILHSIQKDGLFVWIDKTLDMLIDDPKLKEFISTNPEFIPNLAKGVIDGTPFLKEITGKFKLDNEVLDLLSTLLVKPEIARAIIKDNNKGDYIKLTDTLINALNDKDIPNLSQVLKMQAEKGLFNNLTIGIIEQLPNLGESLKNYGVTTENLPQIANIFPVLLDHPKELGKVFNQFKLGQYNDMMKELLSMVDREPKIRSYFENNRDVFVNVLDQVFTNTESLKGYNLKGDLYEILPSLLNHPQKLLEIITLSEKGNYPEIGRKFLDIVQNDPEIQIYFQTHGNKFEQIAMKAVGLETYGVQDVASGILTKLMTNEHHKESIRTILNLYERGEWSNLIKETCRMMERDAGFKAYIETNKDNFSQIVNAVIDKAPLIKTYTSGVNVGNIVTEIIKDPASIREGLEAFEAGSKFGMMKVAAKKLVDINLGLALGGVLIDSAMNWLYSGEAGKHDFVNNIVASLSSRNDDAQLKLSDFIKTSINKLQLEEDDKKKLNALLAKNTLFDGVTIKGTGHNKLKLTNLSIDNITFVNSKITDVSFKGTKFTNTSFVGSAFSNVDFNGATIDASTLMSMVDSIRRGNISLDGAIITGDLSRIDLSNISLRRADLSQVTSMNDVNLLNCNLTDAKLPNINLLKDTYNLDKCIFTPLSVTEEIINTQKDQLITKLVENVAEKFKILENHILTDKEKANIESKLNDLIYDPIVGEHLTRTLQLTPLDIINRNFPQKPEIFSHVYEYSKTTSNLLTDIYNNKNKLDEINNVIVAGLMADEISSKLFGEGDNRAQDGQMIKKMMQEIIVKFSEENPMLNTTELLDHPKYEEFIDNVSTELKSRSKYTTAGMVTSGIYLPKEVFNKALEGKLKVEMHDKLGVYQFNEKELKAIYSMATQIGTNLFGSGVDSARKADTNLISQNLKDVFYQIKKDKNGADLSDVLTKSVQEIAGSVDKGYLSTSRTGLTELYYNNSSYTTAGYASGGIYLDENKMAETKFINEVMGLIEPITQSVEKLPIAQSLLPALAKKLTPGHNHVRPNHNRNIDKNKGQIAQKESQEVGF